MNTGDITPFTEHRQHLRKHFDRVRKTGRPLIVTTNGLPDAVVLSPDQFDELVADAEYARSLRTIRKSMDEFQAGKGIPAKKVFAKVRRELGLPDKS